MLRHGEGSKGGEATKSKLEILRIRFESAMNNAKALEFWITARLTDIRKAINRSDSSSAASKIVERWRHTAKPVEAFGWGVDQRTTGARSRLMQSRTWQGRNLWRKMIQRACNSMRRILEIATDCRGGCYEEDV